MASAPIPENSASVFDGAASMLGDSRDILLKTDAAGYFDTTFVLKEPTYYTISRNTLYLTPGDDMTIKVTQTLIFQKNSLLLSHHLPIFHLHHNV